MRRLSLVLTVLTAVAVVVAAAQPPSRPAASAAKADGIRLNNLGVATMNQQKFEPALKLFEQAVAADGAFLVARVNHAIALINLQRYEPARQLLTDAVAADPQNVRAWYNLGLLQKSTGEGEQSLAAFEKAAALQPTDAHSAYFVGLMAAQLQQYERAIAAFTRALSIDPFLVSAEFGLARAYQRSGQADGARTHLERFQRLTTEKVASAMSLSYGDQGPLSLAEAVIPAGGSQPAAIPVTFVAEATSPFGVTGTSGATGRGLGAGGCFFDADGDGLVDYLALEPRSGAAGGAAVLFRATGGGHFERVASSGLDVQGQPIACTAADYDNDEKPDVAISLSTGVVLFHNEGGHFTDVTAKSGLSTPSPGVPLGLSFVDYDHDGDLDLVVPRAAAVDDAGTLAASTTAAGRTLVWRNNGNGTFAEVAAERGLAGSGAAAALVATDFNNDRAVDLVITGAPTLTVSINPREGTFTSIAAAQPSASPTFGVVALDVDKDGWMDLAVTHAGRPGLTVWHNAGGKALEPVALSDLGLTRGWGLTALDYDNDGWTDLVVIADAAGASRLVVLRNDGGHFVDQSAAAIGGTARSLKVPRAVVAADLDADGDNDLVVTGTDGLPVVLRNDGGNANHAVRLTLKGLADNRSAVGTKVEVQAGTIWQRFETVAATGLFGQSSPELLIGIGQEPSADVVRLLWPTGVVQDEVEIATTKPTAIEEVDRRGSSCPLVFTWSGHGYDFITDAVGPAVIGHWVAPNETNVADPDEYIRIEGRHLVARDGRLSVRYMEPMEEVNYLDQVRLIAVDHPSDSDIYPNEYFAALAPPPVARIFGVKDTRPPVGAWDDAGRDVLAEIRTRDRQYVSFGDATFRGFARLHALELDLGALPDGGPVRLLMTGFTDYFTATSMFAAHQAKVDAIVPWLEAQAPDGSWTRVVDDIGFPAGLYRTMTADLTGKLPRGTRRIRLWTNLKIYWDQVLVDTTPDGAVPMRTSDVPLLSGNLAFRGFPRETSGSLTADLQYAYDPVSPSGPWARHRGFYTRYGDVTPLLRRVEDRFVIFGAGEEVSLEFDAAGLPPLPAGWTRDYLFYANGYVKDMDFYGSYAQTVTPLPFGTMKTYPYGPSRGYPSANNDYLLEWNTREVATENWPSYRTHYPEGKP